MKNFVNHNYANKQIYTLRHYRQRSFKCLESAKTFFIN